MSTLKTIATASFSILLIVVTCSVAVVCPFLFARRPAGPAGGRAGGDRFGQAPDGPARPALRLLPRDDDATVALWPCPSRPAA